MMQQMPAVNSNIAYVDANTKINSDNTGYDQTVVRSSWKDGEIYQGVTSNNYSVGAGTYRKVYSVSKQSIEYVAEGDSYGVGIYCAVKPSTKYKITYTGTGVACRVGHYQSDGTWIKNTNLVNNTPPIIFTTDANAAFILFVLVAKSGYSKTTITMSDIVIEETE